MEYIIKFYGMDWLAVGMTFLSLHYLGNKHKIGFLFGIIACLAWIAFGLLAGSIASPIANIVFAYLNLRGLIKWREKDKIMPFQEVMVNE